MKNLKKLFSLVVICFAVIALSSCTSSNNTDIPYGSIDNTTFATSEKGNYTVTNKELYTLMRTSGYDAVLRKIRTDLFSTEIAAIDYSKAEDKKEIDEIICTAIFGTDDVETITEYTAYQIKTFYQKYQATMLNTHGILLTLADIEIDFNDETINPNGFPTELINFYKYDLATKRFARSELEKNVLEEFDEEGEDNPNYISDKDIKSAYNSTFKTYLETTAIVIRFNNAADAEKTFEYATETVGELTEENALSFYLCLYNYYYNYRTPLTVDNYNDKENEYTFFEINKDGNDLSSISADFQNFYLNVLEDGKYLTAPRNLGGQYILVYRANTKYFNGTSESLDYKDLTEAQLATIKPIIFDQLVENKFTESYINSIIAERFKELDIQIYDPIFEINYANSYNNDTYYEDGFKNVKKSSSTLVYSFKYNNNEYQLTADDCFTMLAKIYGASTSLTILSNKFLLDKYENLLTSDNLDEYESSYKSTLKSFKKGSLESNGYASNIGETNFLQLYYGYTNKTDVINYYFKASALKTIYTNTQYYYENLANEDGTFNADNQLFKNFQKYAEKAYENQFSLDIVHFLLYVDDNMDGNIDDPAKFRETLSETMKLEFDKAIIDLTNAIIAETKAITTDVEDAFAYIVKAYNEGTRSLYAEGYTDKTWNDFKKFNIQLKTETLGTISNSNAGSYVYPFSKHAQDLYNNIKDDFNEEDGYLEFSETPLTTDQINEICKTSFGYHIMYVTNLTTAKSAKFEESSDSKLNSDDEYKAYEHIKVTIDEKDEDDKEDDFVIYANAYSDKVTPSTNQLFIYFYESFSDDGVTSFKSSLETAISAVFSDTLSRYTSSSFQQYRLYQALGNITFGTNTIDLKARYDLTIEITQLTIDGYINYDETIGYYFDDWFDNNWA